MPIQGSGDNRSQYCPDWAPVLNVWGPSIIIVIHNKSVSYTSCSINKNVQLGANKVLKNDYLFLDNEVT